MHIQLFFLKVKFKNVLQKRNRKNVKLMIAFLETLLMENVLYIFYYPITAVLLTLPLILT